VHSSQPLPKYFFNCLEINQHLFLIKSSPVTGLEWPRGFQEVKVPDFLTTAQDGGKVVSLISPVTGLEWPRWLQEVKVPRFLDNSTG
jgi:hypothetical protein